MIIEQLVFNIEEHCQTDGVEKKMMGMDLAEPTLVLRWYYQVSQ
jgi:hypothetical protein